MSGWFNSGGLGILGGAMPRQQYDPDDDPMNKLYGMFGQRPPAAGVPVRRMRGVPQTLFGGGPDDVAGGYDPAAPSPQMQGMQRLADQLHQNNQMQPGGGPYGNLSQSPQMQSMRGLAQQNQSSMTAMGNNGRFVRGPNGMRSLPLAAPNGNIDAELGRAQQIRADGRLAQGGMDQFTRKWRGIAQNAPMPMLDDGPSPGLQATRQQLMADMANANRGRQAAKGQVATGSAGKQLGMSIGENPNPSMPTSQDRYRFEKARQQSARERGMEFRQNRMAAMAQAHAMNGPDPNDALNAVMPFMMDPMMPGAQQHNAAMLHMAGMMHGANVQAHGQQLAHQHRMAQLAQNGQLGMAQVGINAHAAGVNPNQVMPGGPGGPNGQGQAFPNQPPPQFNAANLPHVLDFTHDLGDPEAQKHLASQGVTSADLQNWIAQNAYGSLFESQADAAMRQRRLKNAQRLIGFFPRAQPLPQAQQPDPMAGMFPSNPGF